jgi:type II secretory pathway component PulM
MMSSLIQKGWSQRSPRERLLIALALALAIPSGLYYGLWSPGLAAERSASDRSRLAASDLADAQSLSAMIRAQRAARASAAGETLTITLQEVSAQTGVQLLGADRDEAGLAITLASPSSAAVLAWIEIAGERTGLSLEALTIERASGAGVTARIRLSEGLI